jgi:hypothetical protein
LLAETLRAFLLSSCFATSRKCENESPWSMKKYCLIDLWIPASVYRLGVDGRRDGPQTRNEMLLLDQQFEQDLVGVRICLVYPVVESVTNYISDRPHPRERVDSRLLVHRDQLVLPILMTRRYHNLDPTLPDDVQVLARQ